MDCLEVADESIVEDDVGDGGEKASIEATIVSPEGDVGVEGYEGGYDLGDKEEGDGDIERGFSDKYFFGDYHFGDPGCGDDGG